MLYWQIWLIIAGVCFIIEILTVGFFIFWFAIAALIVAALSLVVPSLVAQTAIFIVLSSILIFFTRSFSKKITRSDNVITNSNRLIGKTAIVKKEISSQHNGQVKVEGELWSAVLDQDYSLTIPEGSSVKINAISGVKLVVEPIKIVSNL